MKHDYDFDMTVKIWTESSDLSVKEMCNLLKIVPDEKQIIGELKPNKVTCYSKNFVSITIGNAKNKDSEALIEEVYSFLVEKEKLYKKIYILNTKTVLQIYINKTKYTDGFYLSKEIINKLASCNIGIDCCISPL